MFYMVIATSLQKFWKIEYFTLKKQLNNKAGIISSVLRCGPFYSCWDFIVLPSVVKGTFPILEMLENAVQISLKITNFC